MKLNSFFHFLYWDILILDKKIYSALKSQLTCAGFNQLLCNNYLDYYGRSQIILLHIFLWSIIFSQSCYFLKYLFWKLFSSNRFGVQKLLPSSPCLQPQFLYSCKFKNAKAVHWWFKIQTQYMLYWSSYILRRPQKFENITQFGFDWYSQLNLNYNISKIITEWVIKLKQTYRSAQIY